MPINYHNLLNIKSNIAGFKNVELLIVTKKQTLHDVQDLLLNGYVNFGENRVQEAKLKYQGLRRDYNFKLHLIGPLQSNKTKEALKIFDVIETIDRKNLIDEIFKNFDSSDNFKTKEFFIQVNIGNEPQKSGVRITDLKNLYEYAQLKKLNIKGLMCIPPNITNPSKYFEEMVKLRDALNEDLKLSMGMSADYKIAIHNKSNIIRIGSLIFE